MKLFLSHIVVSIIMVWLTGASMAQSTQTIREQGPMM